MYISEAEAMVFWGDDTGLPMPYRGWNVGGGGQHNCTVTTRATCLKKLLEWLHEYMSVDTVTLLLPVADQQNLAVHATIGLEEEIEQQVRIPLGQGIAGRIAASSKPMIVNDLSKVEVVSLVLRHKAVRSLIGVPLPIKQGMNGVLHVGTLQPRSFNERDVQQLQLVAHCLKLVIADAGLFNFEWSRHNLKSYLEAFFSKRPSRISNLQRVFTVNFSTSATRTSSLLTSA